MGKYINQKKLQQELFQRTEGYAADVRKIYMNAFNQIINLVKGTELEDGKPFSFSEYGYSEETTPILRKMYSQIYQVIRGGVEKEWLNSNANNDALVKSVFGEHSIEDNHFAKYFKRNQEAMNAFFNRKTGEAGLNLSQKVWKYTGMYKDELEDSLDLALGEGTPANRVATKIQKYLQDPDKFYRRFRIKIGEDDDGNPVYGRIWKRRIWSKEDNSYKWVNDDPRKYHPGKGVYRSSARNAQRLARTETNIAYRTADYDRWAELDFITGIEIKLSNNHPTPDICDDLKGIYPKDFKWTGWHPNCRCYEVPVIAPEEAIDKMVDNILDGEQPTKGIQLDKPELPGEFKDWIDRNQDRIETATANGTLPYFIRDNENTIWNKPQKLTPIDIARIRHEQRTPAEEYQIKQAWREERATFHYADRMLRVMGGISDVDTSALEAAYKSGNVKAILSEGNKLKAVGKEIYALDLLDDPMAVAKQFSKAEAEAVHNAVKSKFQKWADSYSMDNWDNLDLASKQKKLNYEIQWLPLNHSGKVWEKTWEVSLKAYQKEVLKVQDAIDWNTIKESTATALNYKTKSKIFQDLSIKLQEAISSKNKLQAEQLLSEIQTKRAELEKAALKRVSKNAPKDPFEAKAYTDNSRNSALWAKSPEDADSHLRSQAEQLWGTSTKAQKEAAHYYTQGSCYLNEPLRGQYYCGGKGRDFATDMKALTEYIESSPLMQDTWLQRGESMGGLRGKFGFDLTGLSEKEAQKFVGEVGTEKAFLSCGNSKGSGFSGEVIYNLYCPKGTRGLYVEPFSYYGHGVNAKSYGMNGSDGLLWDGKTMQSSFGSEAEVILQRGSKFKVKKITRSGSTWFIDIDVVGQAY